MNTILRDISIIWTLIHCCLMFMLLYESRYSQKKTNIITAVFVIPVIVINLLNVWFFGIETAGNLIVPCCVLPSFVFFFIMAKNRDTRFIFTFCLSDTVVLEITIASNIIDTVWGAGNYLVMFIIRLVIYPVLELLLIKYVRKPYQYLQRNTKKGWGIFSLLAAMFYAIILTVTYYPTIILERMEYVPYLIMILALVPIMYLTVFSILKKQLELLHSEEQNKILALQNKMAEERLAAIYESEKKLNMVKHDMKHNAILLSDYIKNNRLEEAREHLKSFILDIDKAASKSYCENPSVNAVLSYYDKSAEENGVKLETSIRLPSELSVDKTDLAVVLSNGLENAINAAKESEKRYICAKAFNDGEKIYIEIINSFSGSIAFEENLPKSKREDHGYGTKSMAAIVNKYGGIYSFETENENFIFRCSM